MRIERFPAREIYDEAALEIAAHLQAGRDVAVLCEGDPFFYGSFMYLFERLTSVFDIEIVPGVSSLMACSAALRRPLAARNDSLAIIPAPLPDRQIMELLERSDAAAIMKIGRHFIRIRELVKRAGLTHAAGYLERVGLENQRILPLGQVEEDSAPYFSMILIYKGVEGWVQDCQIPTQRGSAA
jgi:precorrin-2/cobalt-factor-2 C20-methyltransferase